HHWVIEDCKVLWSNATGIDVGNECWHHKFDPEQTVGYSVIRRCEIIDAGVCGIAGLYAQGMLIEDNLIEGTGWQKMELSWEAGAIKLHNSVNGLFRRNVFKNTFRADCIWLDCGNVNNRITENLFLNGIEQREAIFIECTKEGVNLIDRNIFWNIEGRFDKNKIPVEPGSSGWYKLTEHDVVNGYAIYGEGTDRLQIENNFIGKCRSAGYFAKPVPFRISGRERGGTSRDAKFLNNIFYACGEAAIKMPTEKNESEGNLYVKMPGGYLRIIYPQPEVCLDLKPWQEFYGFDKTAKEGWFDFDVDVDKLTFKVTPAVDKPFFFGKAPEDLIFDPSTIKKDMGHEVGPFGSLKVGSDINIDPREAE
ncbi:MAG: right-handed parallel beta-helix repeat-containing protein, partial [Lachnospiraceae bacterium]|nr:right-handed parallel beta-helix repeat-containing protein [Lachnospiraceae bacterium]